MTSDIIARMTDNYYMRREINSIFSSTNLNTLNIVPYTVNVAPFTLNVASEPINPKKIFNKWQYFFLFLLSIFFIIFSFVDVTPNKEKFIISSDNNSSWQKTFYVVSG